MPTIVYKKQKVIYCAVEKCAISRLIAYFGAPYKQDYNNKVWNKQWQEEQIFYPAHKIFDSSIPFSKVKKKYPGYFSFAFIRNPFDRVVSNYHFNRGPWKRRFGKWPSFTEYCNNMQRWNNLHPICDYIDVDIDFIGRFENFKEDFDKLNEYLGIKNYTNKKHPLNRKINDSERSDYRIYYTKEIRKIIAIKYKEDFKRFGYTF